MMLLMGLWFQPGRPSSEVVLENQVGHSRDRPGQQGYRRYDEDDGGCDYEAQEHRRNHLQRPVYVLRNCDAECVDASRRQYC